MTNINAAHTRTQPVGRLHCTPREAWVFVAIDHLREFAKRHGGAFIIEHARESIAPHLPEPDDHRVWGRVTQLAAQEGVIARVPKVYMPAASSHGCPKPAWRKGPNA